MKSTIYEGYRSSVPVVTKVDASNHRSLMPSYSHLKNHSPSGFEWGYNGSGPSQLAFALVYDITQDEELTLQLYQEFKRKVIAALPPDKWTLSSNEIKEHLRKIWKDAHDPSNR